MWMSVRSDHVLTNGDRATTTSMSMKEDSGMTAFVVDPSHRITSDLWMTKQDRVTRERKRGKGRERENEKEPRFVQKTQQMQQEEQEERPRNDGGTRTTTVPQETVVKEERNSQQESVDVFVFV